MNVAVIIAGGSGHRMGQDIPKQFINVYDKPVLIYTLESFQRNDLIDAIEVVCIDGWHNVLWAYAKQFNITKVKWVISGGNSAQESIRNGVYNLKDVCSADDNIIIHDGIRPLVDDEVLEDVIAKCNLQRNTFHVRHCAAYRHHRHTSLISLCGRMRKRLQRKSVSTVLLIRIR